MALSPTPLEYIERSFTPRLSEVVRAVLLSVAGNEASATHAVAISDREWSVLRTSLLTHRVASLLSTAVEAGLVTCSSSVAEQASSDAREAAALAMLLTHEGSATVSALTEHNLDVRVLKGLATGAVDYPPSAVRHTGDVDLLVKPQDFEAACGVLRSLSVAETKSTEPVDLLVESTFKTASGLELDLHHRLFRIAPAETPELFDDPTPLPNGLGHALSLEGRLLHAAGHLLVSPPGHRRLSSLVDVALLDAHVDLDGAKLAHLTQASRLGDLVDFARWLARSLAADHPGRPPAWKPTSVVNRAHIRTRRSLAWETAAVLAQQKSSADRVRYVTYQLRRGRKSRS